MAALLKLLVLLAAVIIVGSTLSRPDDTPEPVLEIRDLVQPTQPTQPPPPAPQSPPAPAQPAAPALTPLQPPSLPLPVPPPNPLPPLLQPLMQLFPEPRLSDREFYDRFSGSVIQVLCHSREELFTASGVIVNDRGLVLTNGHVAQIVADTGPKNCQARHGNPAERFAGLEVAYIADITLKIPETEVPQRDLAFLRLVEPESLFSVAPVSVALLERGEHVLTLGYPSEFLQSIITSANSNLVFSALAVGGYADVDDNLSTAEGYVFIGGIILQQGSSGTAIFTRRGEVAALMFATTKGATTADRKGIALTTPYMDKVLRLETGQGLLEFVENR